MRIARRQAWKAKAALGGKTGLFALQSRLFPQKYAQQRGQHKKLYLFTG